MDKRVSSTVWIFVAFVPWIIYWSPSGPGLMVPGVGDCGQAAIGYNRQHYKKEES
jgi:hypothetical protein